MEILRFNSQCVECILGKFLRKVPEGTDEVTKLDYARKLLKIIADADNNVSAPEIVAMATALKNDMFGFSDDFAEIKRYFNDLMLSKEKEFRASIENSAEPFETAVKFALLGNYIDFGAMYSVSEEKLNELIETVETAELDKREFEHFLSDLEKAKTLVYLTDNCGEIVLDKLLVEQLKQRYPHISIKVIVRGQPVLNDATEEDAAQVGLFDVTTVINNGTDIAGTCIEKLSDEARSLVENADVIISKGQGNFETLRHSGLNIYYIFLCKCDLFSDQFKVPKLTGMFLNDRRMTK